MNWMKIFFCVGCLCLLSLSIAAQELSWQLVDHEGSKVLKLEGMNQSAGTEANTLQVFVGERSAWPGANMPDILGTYTMEEEAILFQPAFPFRESLTYTAFWDGKHAYIFTIPVTTPPTELTKIYPSGGELPANLLKVYLHFSAPMGEGRAYDNLQLVSAAGDTIYQPFVPLQPELWSEDRTRLTLWLDPGRVKRGLLSHETHGVVLQEGGDYTLTIDKHWTDAAGQPLGKNYRKDFRVVGPDYRKPEPARWTYELPGAGTTEPVMIDFGESMDQALASRSLSLQVASGEPVDGAISVEAEESRWYFYPRDPWPEGDFTIVVDSNLEDLAGNNLNRPFDREIVEGEKIQVAQDFYTINFKIKASK
ncbi:Ig-like domain-containing protein [Flavilitoribacter nigricans]|uniref:SbsA Ig-like domain-containing protein n=1 Tax=Flavilitoribacter nigricans (strain ATCC 23147 / DSM 23189 / NBRC 102662 / NCIMB 1420 / SS-2) TaxID=1122177 RepID=A0A2D0N6V2_FLAN2|nr:Ig-like domain-containing protein [Flavilitoribacter nigricans]PHN04262.1 hypothetical protein CRP01_22125 [Flavilitoribacter nigricans DSM 23189 = NBRC 102662]